MGRRMVLTAPNFWHILLSIVHLKPQCGQRYERIPMYKSRNLLRCSAWVRKTAYCSFVHMAAGVFQSSSSPTYWEMSSHATCNHTEQDQSHSHDKIGWNAIPRCKFYDSQILIQQIAQKGLEIPTLTTSVTSSTSSSTAAACTFAFLSSSLPRRPRCSPRTNTTCENMHDLDLRIPVCTLISITVLAPKFCAFRYWDRLQSSARISCRNAVRDQATDQTAACKPASTHLAAYLPPATLPSSRGASNGSHARSRRASSVRYLNC